MALGFSSGLLTGMQTLGQGGTMPSDPNQQNLLQKAGVTNPLLQQFGQGFGGVMGVETRSPMEQFMAATKGLDTSTPEGRAAYLKALAGYKPEEAVKQAMAFKEQESQERLRKVQELKYEQEIDAGKIKTGSRTVAEPQYTRNGDPILDANGKPVMTEKTVQFTMRQLEDGKWYEVRKDPKTGELVPLRELDEEEVKTADVPTTGTLIKVGDKQVPVFDKGDYYEDAQGFRYNKESYDLLKKDEEVVTPPSITRGQPAPVDPAVRARGTGGRSGNVVTTGMLTNSEYSPRTRSGR